MSQQLVHWERLMSETVMGLIEQISEELLA